MHAAIVDHPGAAPRAGEFPDPAPSEGREIVELVAAGLHPLVRQLAVGAHYASAGDGPRIPGIDAVARTADGRLVYTGFTQAPYGTFAERMSVPPMGVPLPAAANPIQIAAAMNPGMASWLPLQRAVAALDAADKTGLGTVLVLGASGVAGMLAVQNALALGALRVVAAARRVEAIEDFFADSNRVASVALTGDPTSDADRLRAAFGAERPRLVLDFVWGPAAEAAFQALARHGFDEDDTRTDYVEIGQSAGPTAALPAALLRSTAITVRGSGAGSAPLADILNELPRYLGRIASGEVRVPVETYPLARISEAWADTTPGRRIIIVP